MSIATLSVHLDYDLLEAKAHNYVSEGREFSVLKIFCPDGLVIEFFQGKSSDLSGFSAIALAINGVRNEK